MQRREFLWMTGVATAGAAISSGLAADDGFKSLCDGKTLAGWHKPPHKMRHGSGGSWTVEPSGVLVCEQDPPGSGNGGILLSDEEFGDFELEFEMNPGWGADSGVFFRCTDAGDGFQYYVDYHNSGNVGHLRGEMQDSFAIKPFQIFAKPGTE